MTKAVLEQHLALLEAMGARGAFCNPADIVRMDNQMKEIRKKLMEL